MEEGDDCDEALADVVARERRVLRLEEVVGLPVLVDGAGERGTKAGQVGAAVRVGDRVGEAEDLVGDRVVILEDDVEFDRAGGPLDDDRGFLDPGDADGLGVDDLLVFAELLDEFLDAVLVIETFRFGLLGALVGEDDFEAGIEKGEFPQAADDEFLLELDRLLEDLRVGLEGDEGAGRFALADDVEFFDGFAPLELHVVDLAVARNLDLEPFRDGVDALRADAVGAAGEDVAALAVFAAGVEPREHHFHGGHGFARMEMEPSTWAVTSIFLP